jgi:hypothetical protein
MARGINIKYRLIPFLSTSNPSQKYSKVFHLATSFKTISPTYVLGIYFELKTRILRPPEHSISLIRGHSYASTTPTSRVFSTTVIFIVTPYCSVHLHCFLLQKNAMHSSLEKICFASIAGAICISIISIPPSILHRAHNPVV